MAFSLVVNSCCTREGQRRKRRRKEKLCMRGRRIGAELVLLLLQAHKWGKKKIKKNWGPQHKRERPHEMSMGMNDDARGKVVNTFPWLVEWVRRKQERTCCICIMHGLSSPLSMSEWVTPKLSLNYESDEGPLLSVSEPACPMDYYLTAPWKLKNWISCSIAASSV